MRIPHGITLTILPGTVIALTSFMDSAMEVEGELLAIGEKDAWIRFMVEGPSRYFGGLRFLGKAASGHLAWVEIQNGRPFTVQCLGASPRIEHCLFRNATYQEGGLMCVGGAAPVVSDTEIRYEKSGLRRPAVLCFDSSPALRGNRFQNYLIGVQCSAAGERRPTMAGNTYAEGAVHYFDEKELPHSLALQEVFSFGHARGPERMDFIRDLKLKKSLLGQRLIAQTYSADFAFKFVKGEYTFTGTRRRRYKNYGQIVQKLPREIALGPKAEKFGLLTVPSAFSHLKEEDCRDTPSSFVVLFRDRKGEQEVVWASPKFKRGHLTVLAADTDRDGGEELIIGNSGLCDHFGQLHIFDLAPTPEQEERGK